MPRAEENSMKRKRKDYTSEEKVLVISAAFPPHRSGEATNTVHLCHKLAERGLEVHVLTSLENTVIFEEFTVHPVMSNWSWNGLPRFAKAIKRISPDAIILMYIGWIYNYHPMITYSPSIAKYLLPNASFVTRFENITGTVASTFFSKALRKIAAQICTQANFSYGTLFSVSDYLIFLSDNHRANLSHQAESVDKKAILIPPAPNMSININGREGLRKRGRDKFGLGIETFLISYIGYIYPAKGLEVLLHAFKYVSDSSSKFRLVLIGGEIAEESGIQSGYKKSLEELTDKLSISEKIIWTGEYTWNDHKTSEYLLASDVCVLPFEVGVQLNNSSLSCVAAHGIPVITTRGTVVEKPFIHGDNVYLCPLKSPESIAEAILKVKDDEKLRLQLQEGVVKLAHDWFSWENTIDKTIDALSSIQNRFNP
jgi:polysaccharide biosynthesis protein PslF